MILVSRKLFPPRSRSSRNQSLSLTLSESQQRIRYIEDVLLSIHRVEANYRKPRREKFETFLMKLADVEIHNDMEFSRTERKRKRERKRERCMLIAHPFSFLSFFLRDSRGKNFVKMTAYKLERQVSWD